MATAVSIVDDLLEAATETETFHFHIERKVIQEGKTFSKDAMHETFRLMAAWVEARILTRWETTGEPPSVCDIDVTVKVQ